MTTQTSGSDVNLARWISTLRESVLAESADERLKARLREILPPFEPPADASSWRETAHRLRRQALDQVYLRGIPREWVDAEPDVVWGQTLEPDRSYRIRKLRYQIFPDYWIPALLYEPTNLTGPAPVMLNPNGHHWGGKAAIYKQARCINLARRGVISLNFEFIGMGELQADVQHNHIAHLHLTGLSGAGLFYLALKKGLDVLLAHPHADPRRAGVTGLSGGGWQTIVFAALDERVTLAVPVSGYNALPGRLSVLDDIGDMEQAPPDMAAVLDYSHMTAMLAPRPALIVLNEYDSIFRTDRTRSWIYGDVLPVYRALEAEDNFEFYSSKDPGNHCYEEDIRKQLYRFIGKHWSIDSPVRDLHRDDEILPEWELNVGLPDEQTHIMEIAYRRAKQLAHARPLMWTASDRSDLRSRIAEVIRLPREEAVSWRKIGDALGDPSTANYELRVGAMTIPVSVKRGDDTATATLIIDESGRAGHTPPCEYCLAAYPTNAVVADIFGMGENRCDHRLSMLLESAGHRLLGIQVAQIHACAQLASELTGAQRVDLAAIGTTASFACLVAAALKRELFASLSVARELTTLTRLIEWGERYENHPSLFCFGLLEVADVPELRALLEGMAYIQRFRYVR